MSRSNVQSLFFITLPDLRKLCSVNISQLCDPDDGETRNNQIRICRELLFLCPELLASPVLDSFGEITVIMAITFFKTGIIQAYTQRHSLQMGTPRRVLPAILKACLSYTLTAKMAPEWNKAGQFLIAGTDFLTESGRLNAVVMELNATETQLCICVEAKSIRLPPAKLEDFDISANAVKNFYSSRDAEIQTYAISNNWCYILPSMKMGQIISISHLLPSVCPFESYTEIQKHWNILYGYKIPAVNGENEVYCNVYFKLVGERLFTYPLCCIRSQPVQCFSRVDLDGVLNLFLKDLKANMENICGFAVQMTSKPCYFTSNLNNVSTKGLSIRPVNLTAEGKYSSAVYQLPIRAAPQPRRDAVLGMPPSQERESRSSPYVVGAAGEHTEHRTPDLHSESKPTSTSSTQQPRRLVPIFKNKALKQQVNVTKILAEIRPKTQPAVTPLAKAAVLQWPPTSSFKRSNPGVGTSRPDLMQPSSTLKYSGHPSSFSSSAGNKDMESPFIKNTSLRKNPEEKCLQVDPSNVFPTSTPVLTSNGNVATMFMQSGFQHSKADLAIQACTGLAQKQKRNQIISQGDGLEYTSKKSRPIIQDVDVEEYARSNQLSKLNSATLQAWLKMNGISVKSRDKKEELVSKVIQSICEP
uniref:Chromosome LG9 open reading frame, human C18orf63 n=1 Tax=Lepisosteus oculatus TaxID=7918 RepID=W5N2M0_LEPOC|nr:PREDICTED: uncharacterized protein C18orf63 homolog isoform X1 [Lepisosteus oculatus]XP_015210131.1 PREDICTED: uncharacterized protein C18orf63 homolog isoform X1 [Lepisosteus oculatus]